MPHLLYQDGFLIDLIPQPTKKSWKDDIDVGFYLLSAENDEVMMTGLMYEMNSLREMIKWAQPLNWNERFLDN